MTTYAVAPGTIATSGVDVASASGESVDAAEPILTYGQPVAFTTATDQPYTVVDAVRARVVDDTGTFVRHLDKLDGLRFLDELNTAGAGSIDMQRYFAGAATSASGVLSPDQHIIVSVGSRDVFRIVLNSEPGYRIDEAGNRVDAWAGTGALGVLDNGTVLPEYGFRAEATEDRSFDYGSSTSIGGWYVASEWKTPVGKPVRKSWRWTYRKRHLPKKWPDKKAQWIWYRNPDAKKSANETCYLISSFTMSSAGRVRFLVCGDDTLEFQVDGEVRATTGPGGWKKPTKVVLSLSAGTHYIAAKVSNTAGSTGNANRSGFLCSVAQINGDGDVTKVLRRSNPAHWKVRRQLSGPPGWFPAQILKRLVDEQKSRGCASHSLISYGFTTATDSLKRAWTGRRDVSIPVGTKGLDYVQQIVEMGVDVYMTPGLKLHAYRSRGTDRSRTVRLDQGGARVTDRSGAQEPPIQNVVYAKAKSGWATASSSASIAARGRRETLASLGGSRSQSQTAAQLRQMLGDLASPPQTHQVSISGAAPGPQPYVHFDNGDWVSYRAPGRTTWQRVRVMSIGLEVNPAGHADWTVTVVED